MSESIIQATIGAIIGIVLASIVVVTDLVGIIGGIETEVNTELSISLIFQGFGFAILGGLIAGSLPAWVASRLRPADTLRGL
jgi:putative ABC transport system permease protein